MRKLVGVLCLLIATCSPALAQDKSKDNGKKAAPTAGAKKEPSEKQETQQEPMKDCNAKAGDRKGDERKAFVSKCLKREEAAKKAAQQYKMTACTKEASAMRLKDDERKAFMSGCLKG